MSLDFPSDMRVTVQPIRWALNIDEQGNLWAWFRTETTCIACPLDDGEDFARAVAGMMPAVRAARAEIEAARAAREAAEAQASPEAPGRPVDGPGPGEVVDHASGTPEAPEEPWDPHAPLPWERPT